jgi:hypothetical protein
MPVTSIEACLGTSLVVVRGQALPSWVWEAGGTG